MTTYYVKDVFEKCVSSNIHVHSPERWRGKANPQTATNWAADTVSVPYVLTSGNNTWGAEVQILGTADTPIIPGSAKFDARPILITDLSQATNPYKLRFVWGTGTYADAVAANQYTEFMLISGTANAAQFGGSPEQLQMPNLDAGTKVWGACWCLTNNATVTLYIGLHEYPTITGDENWTAGNPLAVDVSAVATASALSAVADDVEAVKAAVYDTATVDGNDIELSNGAIQTVTSNGRVTVEGT